MQRGHDPKAFTEQVVRFLREMFLSSMAPQLVQLSEEHAKVAADMTARYGIASVVRAIEVLGEALLDIRRAPDPRLVLEVTLVRLASSTVANDTASLLARVERLESGGGQPRDATGPIPRPRLAEVAPSATKTSRATNTGKPTPASSAADKPDARTAAAVGPVDDLVAAWPGIVRTLKATVRALYSAVEVVGLDGDVFVVSAPSDMHKKKCLELQDQVNAALTRAAARSITIDIRVQAPRSASPGGKTVSSQSSPRDQDGALDGDVLEDGASHDDAPVESVVDQIAKSFPGARIVDSSKN